MKSQAILEVAVKWSRERVLAEARRRTKEHFNDKGVQAMLARLLVESGWTEQEFIDALCQDVVHRASH